MPIHNEDEQLTQQAFTFITHESNSRVLYGVLKRLNVHPGDSNFDDAVSEGRLIYVAVFKDYVNAFGDQDADALRRYAYQRLYWRLLDWLRASTRRLSHQSELSDTVVNQLQNTEVTAINMENHDFINRLITTCTPSEKRLLSHLLDEEMTISQAAKSLHVSRPTLYKHRERLAAKLQAHFPEFF